MSRSTIADLLRQYSKESVEAEENGETNLDEGQVGAEEILVVSDEHTTELEEAIEEIAETVNEKVEAEAALDSVIEATESLESAIASIRQARLQGHRVNGVAMQIWTRGVVDSMEARQLPSELFASLQEDYGDSFEADSYADHSFEAEEKGEGILTKIWNMIKAAFAAVRDWFTRFMAWFTKSAQAIEKAGIALKKAAAEKKTAKASDAKIASGPYSDLVEGGQFKPTAVVKWVGDTVSTVAGQARILHVSMLDGAQKLESRTMTVKLMDDIKDAVTKVNGLVSKGSPSGLVAKFEVETDTDKGKVKYTYKLDAQGASKSKGDIAIMSVADIAALGAELESVGRGVGTTLRDLSATVNKSPSLNVSGAFRGEAIELARKTSRVLVAGTKIAQNITSDAAKLTLPLAKKAYALGVVCLRRYK